VLGIVGIRTETHEDKEFPPKRPGGQPVIRRTLTKTGQKILLWTIFGFAVALLAQIAEEIKSHIEDVATQEQATNMLHSTTQSLAYVTRMIDRFQTFTVDAQYAVPLTENAFAPLATILKDATNPKPKALPTGVTWTTNGDGPELKFDIAALTNHLAANKLAVSHLAPLLDAEMAIDIYAEADPTNSLFSTFGCEHHRHVELACVPSGTNLLIRWKVFFPNSHWYQTRHLVTDSDLAGKVLQVGLADCPGFSRLRPTSLHVLLDGESTKLKEFKPVDAWMLESRRESLNKSTKQPKKGSKAPPTKDTAFHIVSTNVPGRRDPTRGKLVANFETKVPLDDAKR